MKIGIINGPNLNWLGKREPEIYGTANFDDLLKAWRSDFENINIDYFQSNHEGALIDQLQAWSESHQGIILNAAGYSHSSIAIADTVKMITAPVIEVHISNTQSREEFRRHSYISGAADGTIQGLGIDCYRLAILHLVKMNDF